MLDVASTCIRQQFLSERAVRTQALTISQIVKRDSTQRIFPSMYFSCNGLLTKWIIGGIPGITKNPLPELQLWRTNDGTNYFKTSFSPINHLPKITSHTNVYEYILEPPLEFQEGDVFGLYKPKENESVLNIFIQENSGPFAYGQENGTNMALGRIMVEPSMPLTQNDYPMVSVEISVASRWHVFLINIHSFESFFYGHFIMCGRKMLKYPPEYRFVYGIVIHIAQLQGNLMYGIFCLWKQTCLLQYT